MGRAEWVMQMAEFEADGMSSERLRRLVAQYVNGAMAAVTVQRERAADAERLGLKGVRKTKYERGGPWWLAGVATLNGRLDHFVHAQYQKRWYRRLRHSMQNYAGLPPGR